MYFFSPSPSSPVLHLISCLPDPPFYHLLHFLSHTTFSFFSPSSNLFILSPSPSPLSPLPGVVFVRESLSLQIYTDIQISSLSPKLIDKRDPMDTKITLVRNTKNNATDSEFLALKEEDCFCIYLIKITYITFLAWIKFTCFFVHGFQLFLFIYSTLSILSLKVYLSCIFRYTSRIFYWSAPSFSCLFNFFIFSSP